MSFQLKYQYINTHLNIKKKYLYGKYANVASSGDREYHQNGEFVICKNVTISGGRSINGNHAMKNRSNNFTTL
jgi:hypothetical protein